MNPPKILTIPYGLARTSLTIAGELVPRQLRPGPLVGQAVDIVGRLTGHRPASSVQDGSDGSDGVDALDSLAAEQREKLAEAKRQRATATKAKQHASARGNRNLSTIRRDLVVAEAQAEVRDQQAEEKAKE